MPLSPWGLSKGLIQRIKDRVQRALGDDGPDDDATPDRDTMLEGPGTDAPVIMYRIRYAARSRTMLHMKYNNDFRYVEPYSFRYRSRGMQPLFYGYCHLHDTIEAYRIDRIQDVQTTDRPYNPRWTVEIA